MKRLYINLGFFLGTVFVLLGIATLFGVLIPKESLEQFNQLKWVLGIVLLLYGFYRLITSYIKLRNFYKDDGFEKRNLF